jgi:hypothetical protein
MLPPLTLAEQLKNVAEELETSEEIFADELIKTRNQLQFNDEKLLTQSSYLWDLRDRLLADRESLAILAREKRIEDLEFECDLSWSLVKAIEEQVRGEQYEPESGLGARAEETLGKARERAIQINGELTGLKREAHEEEEARLRKALADAQTELAGLKEFGGEDVPATEIAEAEEELRLSEGDLADFLSDA